MLYNDILIDIGFTQSETKIYLAALSLGESTASLIAKKSRIKRPSAYVLLKSLIKKGAISSYTRRKVTRFVATSPEKIIKNASDKAERAKQILPELQALANTKTEYKPKVSYYEGLEGLITIMEDTLLKPNKTIYTWADGELAWNTLSNYYPEYIRKKNEQNIFVKAILVDNPRGVKFLEKSSSEHRQVLLIPKQKFPMSNEINIYDDKIFIISHKDLVGVIIQNKEIAETQRSIFELCWEGAKHYNNKGGL